MKKTVLKNFLLFLSVLIPGCENIPVPVDFIPPSSGETEPIGVPFFLSAFQIDNNGYEAEGGAGWVQITVSDETKLQNSWKLCTACSNLNKIVLFDSKLYNSSPWNLHTGDRVRIHPSSGYTGPDDRLSTICGEDNEYDYITAAAFPSSKCGLIWLEDCSGKVCDIVYYSNNQNTETKIVSKKDGTLSDGQKALNNAVTNGEWNSAEAIFPFAPASGYAHISYSTINAVSPADWQCLTGSSINWETYVTLDSFNAAPQVVVQGEPVTIKAELRTFHGATVNAVWFDFYSPESDYTPPSQRITDNINGVYSYEFDTSDYPAGTWYVLIYVDSDYTEIEAEISFEVH